MADVGGVAYACACADGQADDFIGETFCHRVGLLSERVGVTWLAMRRNGIMDVGRHAFVGEPFAEKVTFPFCNPDDILMPHVIDNSRGYFR